MVKFWAEIKEIKVKKTVSLDLEYSIKLTTDNKNLLELGNIPADQIVEVQITGK